MLTEKEAEQLIERQQRYNDMLLMRAMDEKLGVKKAVIENPLIEMNMRMIAYVQQFKSFTLHFLALQVLQDLRQYLIIMQAKKIDIALPVAMLKDEQHTKIFINAKMTKDDFANGGVFYFVREELKG